MKRVILASKQRQKYQYSGPAYRFQDYVGDFKMETLASSKSEAKRNFQYRIKQQLNLVRNAKISLDDACIITVDN